MIKYLITLTPLLFAVAACSDNGNAPEQQAAKQQVGKTETQPRATSVADGGDPHAGLNMRLTQAPTGAGSPRLRGGGTGRVKQVLQAGNYTYVEVDTGKASLWMASNPSKVKTGDKIAWRDGAIMHNFHSKALKRDFKQIMFVSEFVSPNLLPKPKGGVVLSRQDAAGYTYLEIDTGNGREWVALPTTNVNVGEKVHWLGGSRMHDFHSSSLNRDFDSIWFINRLETSTIQF